MLWPLFSVDQVWAIARPAMLSGAACMLAVVLLTLAIAYRLRMLYIVAAAAFFTSLLPISLHPELLPFYVIETPIASWLASLSVLAPLILLSSFIAFQLPADRRADVPVVLLGLVFLLPIIWLFLAPFLLGLRVFNGALLLGVWLPTLLAVSLFLPHWRNHPARPFLTAAGFCFLSAASVLYLAMQSWWLGPASESLYLLSHIAAIFFLSAIPIHGQLRHARPENVR